jgi:predicted ester cyclase
VPPTNRDVDFSFAVFFKLNEQHIATHHGYFDRMLFLRQLGLT